MTHMVLLDGVEKWLGRPTAFTLALDQLELAEGEMVALTGPSGSGKTTLLNLLGLLDVPDKGSIVVGGVDVTGSAAQERAAARARLVGFVFQNSRLLAHFNALDNVALGARYADLPRKHRYEEALVLLGEVGLQNRAKHSPSTLSGGEQQRVAIARALMGGRRLLLCDEPTGNLDSQASKTVVSLLRQRADEGRTVVVATHDPVVAASTDRVVRLVDGREAT